MNRLLSDVKITSFHSLKQAITNLHQTYHIPHIIITSIRFDSSSPTLSIVGSTARRDGSPRCFRIDVPAIDCFFSGTGDMFAALTVVRLREATTSAGLHTVTSWLSPDDVEPVDLPLAKASEKVLGSMHAILQKTKKARDEALADMEPLALEKGGKDEKRLSLLMTKAAEVRVVRNLGDLIYPESIFRAQAFEG
jgi:pyridoxine kinase